MSETTETKKIALYYYEDSDTYSILDAEGWVTSNDNSNYSRCSEIEEVTFNILPHKDIVLAQVAALNRQKVRNMASFNVEQMELEQRINDLLALPNLTGESE